MQTSGDATLNFDDRHKKALRNGLLAGAAALAVHSYLTFAEVTRWETLADKRRMQARLCQQQLTECQVLEAEQERRRPKLPPAPRERRQKAPCPPADMSIPMQRPCPEPTK